MSKTEFAEVLEFLNDNVSKGPPLSEDEICRYNLLKKSLRIADKLMQEPSEAVVNATGAKYISSGDLIAKGIWKAMRDAMLKEIEG